MTEDRVVIEAAGHEVAITHPDKVWFPERGETKLDLARYYLAVAEPLMAAVRDRPVMLQRYPEGAGGPSFFQKRVPASRPKWLQTSVVATPNGTTSEALVAADIAHLLWAVNLGCLGFHVWPTTASDPEHADELRIDLDPSPGVTFEMIREAAAETRDLLEEAGAPGRPKTTGNRGIHVYVRLQPRWTSYEVRAAAVAVARELERRRPDLCTAAWWKEERGTRVFVDFNQNAPHKTVFGAWSVRGRVGGQVSTPFGWDELETIEPDACTLVTVPQRVREQGDPWADLWAEPRSLEGLLQRSAADLASGLGDAPWPPVYPKMPGEPPRVAPSRARPPGAAPGRTARGRGQARQDPDPAAEP
jgi:DNA ligase D